MAEFPRDYQILVADDASTDKTSEVLSPYARVLPLTVVRTESRRGYSASLEMLLREAVRRSEYPKRDVIVTIQADFSQEPEDIVPIIKAMEAGADIVCGESTMPPETAWKIRWSRRMAAKLLGRKSVPAGVKDPFTGFRAYRVFTIKKAMDERAGGRLLLHDSWAANAELLAVTTPHARRVDPIDVTVRPHRLQRDSRLQPWPALKNVWAYARKAKPEVEAASVLELDESVASGAISRKNDVESVRERMSERSDMHGNRSPHGDRQPHNARPEPRRGERPSRDRNTAARERPRTEAPRAERPKADRAQSDAQPKPPQGERQRNPRGERKPKEARPPREAGEPREQSADRPKSGRPQRVRADSAAAASADAADLDVLKVAGENGENPEDAAQTGEPTKRRRRRGRRSRGGANKNANNVEGDVISPDAEPGSVASAATTGGGADGDDGDAASGDDTASDGETTPGADGAPAKKRRRGRRGGRGRRRQSPAGENAASEGSDAGSDGGTAQSDSGAVSTNGDNHAPPARIPALPSSTPPELNDVA